MPLKEKQRVSRPKLKSVVTIGNFDGVHRGHQALINNVVIDAKNRNYKSIAVTFLPHPATFFQPERGLEEICSIEYKGRLFRRLGLDEVIVLRFNEELAHLEPAHYVKHILLEQLNATIIWVGYDFTFGRNRSGTARTIEELGERYGYEAHVLAPQHVEGKTTSSTKIRGQIKAGEVDTAAKLLGRKHLIRGVVVSGDRKATEWGFPTINVDVREGMLPATGIYSGIVQVEKQEYPAAIYIGYRPTVTTTAQFRVEAHLLGFSQEIYGATVSLAFFKFIRKDMKFENIEALLARIQVDCEKTRSDFDSFQQFRLYSPVIW